ncbi:MAG TPA: DUF1236 domain-containing protein [Rhizomicrobium sp.]|jgi:hypothetical protein|nr:DUF1236 domain-containing protein [Rhizomicrobium sp.]
MKNRLFALAAAALLSGTAAVCAQGLPQDQSHSPKAQTKDQMARPDAQPGLSEDQGSAGGTQKTPSRENRSLQSTQMQGRDQMQGERRGPQGGEMIRGGEMRSGAPHTLTVEQKTKLRETVFRSGPRLSHIGFRIGVGVAIPRNIHVVAVPQEIVSIYPEWAGDLYFVYGDEIVVVAPGSFEIVGVLPL